MAKRRPPNDDQWDRTSGGLIVPRRGVSLPTRRWIGWMGGAKDCCSSFTCSVFASSPPSSIVLAVTGETDGNCNCAPFNDTWELPYAVYTSFGTPVYFCSFTYRDTPNVPSVSVAFSVNTNLNTRTISARVYIGNGCDTPCGNGNQYVDYLFQESSTTLFASGTYESTSAMSGCPEQSDDCGGTGVAEFTIP
jgi:hypothetical protein